MERKVYGLLRQNGKLLVRASVVDGIVRCDFFGGKRHLSENPQDAITRLFEEKYCITLNKSKLYWQKVINTKDNTEYFNQYFLCEAAEQLTEEELNNLSGKFIDIMKIDEYVWPFLHSEFVNKLSTDAHYFRGFDKEIIYTYSGDICKKIIKDTQTLKLMDRFDGIRPSRKAYKRLIIENPCTIHIEGNDCTYMPIIEHVSLVALPGKEITFSDFKKDSSSVYNYCNEQLKNAFKIKKSVFRKDYFYFDHPYYLKAQNSECREGYGDEWYGGVCIHEGTKYGETSYYGFTGVKIINFKSNQQHKTKVPIRRLDNKCVAQRGTLSVIPITHEGKNYFKVVDSRDGKYLLIPYEIGMRPNRAFDIYDAYMLEQKKNA